MRGCQLERRSGLYEQSLDTPPVSRAALKVGRYDLCSRDLGHMKRGGWAHFEGAKGLGRVKHPCFNRGEGLGRRRDNETPDLFDKLAPPDGGKGRTK
jgi:hypothetical protein